MIVPEAAARVITKKFFRGILRPARMLRNVRSGTPLATSAVLLEGVPAGSRARSGAGAPLD
jgi:hypothetical protein